MSKINFDDLKRLHDKARISSVGSKVWIDFAQAMIDNFPSIYETAKAMNHEMVRLCQDRKWQSIESAPKDCRILLYYPDLQGQLTGQWMVDIGWLPDLRVESYCQPTHWMNLPEEPTKYE